MKKLLMLASVLIGLLTTAVVKAQIPGCQSSVPYYYVNLTGQPAGQWTSPTHSRGGDCCTDNNCTSFEVILDTGAAMVEVGFDMVADPSQAVPNGSLFYQVGCGPQTSVGTPLCITGVGPHYISFCKPGNNKNTYYIKSYAKPIYPKEDSVRIGCSKNLTVLGMQSATVTWQSVFPGAPGAYNSFLSCT